MVDQKKPNVKLIFTTYLYRIMAELQSEIQPFFEKSGKRIWSALQTDPFTPCAITNAEWTFDVGQRVLQQVGQHVVKGPCPFSN